MQRRKNVVNIDSEALIHIIVECLQEKKGIDIRLLDLRHLEEAPADYFIVCEGNSNTQVQALADFVEFEVKQRTGVRPGHIEGASNALWILVDYFDIMLHVFYRETRTFYDIEELWSDAKVTQFAEM